MNKWSVFFLALAALVVVVAVGCSGFNLGDVVKARVPAALQPSIGATTLSYNDSVPAFEKWKADVIRDGQQWRENIDAAGEWVGFFKSFIDIGLEQGGPLLMGLPGGGLLMSGLTFAAGLFTRRPGEKKEIDANWDEAVRQTITAVQTGKAAPFKASEAT